MEMRFISHAEVEKLLHRVGYTQEQIEDLLRDFPDPIDLQRDREALFKHGISLGSLLNQMGASP